MDSNTKNSNRTIPDAPAGAVDKDRINVADVRPRTRAEGPGLRYAIWVQGCPLRCPGCCNPEQLEFRVETLRPVEDLLRHIQKEQMEPDKSTGPESPGEKKSTDRNGADGTLEGVTIIGGEPFAQAAALTQLCARLRGTGLSVMVFTGYTLKQIQKANREDWNAFLKEIDLLVDGPYRRDLPDKERRWIGSTNQEIHFLTDRYAHMAPDRDGWDKTRNTIEIRLVGDQLTINGFPHQSITRAATKRSREK